MFPNIGRVFKTRRMKWVVHIIQVEKVRKTYKILIRRLKEKITWET
jgi:hypothetical protein